MRNKILIVEANANDNEQLEGIFQDIINAGGELFFANRKEDGFIILKKEQPHLVLIDETLMGEEDEWMQGGAHVIVMCRKADIPQGKGNFITKPFKRHQVLEKCRSFLCQEPAVQIPPM